MTSDRLVYSKIPTLKGTLDELGIKISNQNLAALHAAEEDSLSYSHLISSCFQGSSDDSDTWVKRSHIPFQNIIWCQSVSPLYQQENENGKGSESSHDDLLTNAAQIDSSRSGDTQIIEVTYMFPSASNSVKHISIVIELEDPIRSVSLNSTNTQDEVVSRILSKAYSNKLSQPSILVLINPHGGQGHAKNIYDKQILPILEAAHAKVTYKETKYSGHAVEIARTLKVSDYDYIACCSGDGIPHEVINGFYQRSDHGADAFNHIAITQLPCGSGNALSLSTHGSNDAPKATFAMLKASKVKLDLMAVTQGRGTDEVTKLSFLTQCYGIIADSDIGTEHLRWMGPIRFELGVVQKVLKGAEYPCDLFVNYGTTTKDELVSHFNSHSRRNGTASSFSDEQPGNLLTAEDFQLKYPGLDKPPPKEWTHLPPEQTDHVNILYVGKMPYISADTQFFPAALPNDGSMDLVLTDTQTSFIETAKVLLTVDKGAHVHHEQVHHAKIYSYRLIPRLKHPQSHFISVDGESFPFEALQVEVLPGIMTGLLQNGAFVDTCFTQ